MIDFSHQINTALKNNDPIDFKQRGWPVGEIPLDGPIRFPNQPGGLLKGFGASLGDDRARGCVTRLKRNWANDGTPLLELLGVTAKITDLDLDNAQAESACIQVSYREGYGSGKHMIENVTTMDSLYGIKCGNKPNDNNCDELRIRNWRAFGHEASFLSHNHMSLGHVIDNYFSRKCKTHFQVDGGGKLTVNNSNLIRGVLLHVTDDNWALNRSWAPGGNTGIFKFNGITTDKQSFADFVMCWVDPDIFIHCFFNGFLLTNWKDIVDPLVVSGNNANITLTDCVNIPKGSLKVANRKRLHLINTRLRRMPSTNPVIRQVESWMARILRKSKGDQ